MIALKKASSRNTPAHYVNVCGVNILFSYETAVGCNPPDEPSFRRKNIWGPTTGKHLNETGFRNMGIAELDEEQFEVRMNQAILRAVANRIGNAIGV